MTTSEHYENQKLFIMAVFEEVWKTLSRKEEQGPVDQEVGK